MTESLKEEIKRLTKETKPWNKILSSDVIFDNVSMYQLLRTYRVSEEFMIHFSGRMGLSEWDAAACKQVLSEGFMRTYKKKLDWMWICIYQNLTESFMREMKEEIRWNYAAENQVMSDKFILEFYDRLNYYCLVKNKKMTISDNTIYMLSLLIDKELFKSTFIEANKITYERLQEVEDVNTIRNRSEILDL